VYHIGIHIRGEGGRSGDEAFQGLLLLTR